MHIYIHIISPELSFWSPLSSCPLFEVLPSTLNRWTVGRDGGPKAEKVCLQSGFFIEDSHLTEPKKERSTSKGAV